MSSVIEKKCLYLSNFFKTAIEQNRLFHSLILYGGNNYLKYLLSMEIARQLNCTESGEENCECQNCRWIRENKHPAVVTISKIDNKTDSSLTVISEEQVNQVLDTLINSSNYHRVFIFCDAQMKSLSVEEKEKYQEYIDSGFCLPQENIEDKVWFPMGINNSNFSSVAENAMLKSVEEPPSNVTFIFLANSKDDLLQTIVSRSQSFFVGDMDKINYETSFFEKYFENYPYFDMTNALSFAKCLYSYQITKNYDTKYVLDCIQYYLTELIKSNYDNKVLFNIIMRDIEKIEESKKMTDSYIKEQTVYEDLAFYLAKKCKY